MTTPASRRPAGATFRLGAACVTLLLLLLPLLVVARQLADPVRPEEVARLQHAFTAGDAGGLGALAQGYYRNCARVAALPDEPAALAQVVVQARCGQLATLGGAVLVLYLVVLLARGRFQALLTCLGCALVPSLAGDGHVLRVEAPALLGAVFGTLLLQCFAGELARRRDGWRRTATIWGLGGCAALAIGVAVAAAPAHSAVLVLPGIVLSVAAAQLGLRALRLWRRRGVVHLPVPAINRRLLPWTVLALATPAVAWWCLSRLAPAAHTAPHAEAAGVLPGSWLAWPFAAVLGGGALVALLRTGARLRRSGRVDAGLVWFLGIAVSAAAAAGAPPGSDRLPLAAATASLFGEGLFAAVLLVRRLAGGATSRRPRR